MVECPRDETLARLVQGEVGDGERSDVELHLDACADCRELVALLAAGSLLTVPAQKGPPRPSFLAPRDGDTIARYRVERRLGVGGMGIVYLCTDPELGRPVAVKVLLSRMADDPAHQRRLLREARTLASLSHPNVVPVFDAGLHEGRVFIAMEYVRGRTLREWLETPRSVAAIVDTFCEVARGLQAAHDAGLVHRDVKPDNVMLGGDGRAMVTDFGLVQAVPGTPTRPPPELATTPEAANIGASTNVGSHGGVGIAGTPAYMAPEQIRGHSVDPRADQFSLCVALFEALYGERPFAGRSVQQLLLKIESGQRAPPPASSDVPERLAAVVDRGLAMEPTERWPDMTSFAEALEHAHRGRRSRILPVTGAGIAAILFVVAAASREAPVHCHDARRHLERIWDPSVRAEVKSAVGAIDVAYAPQTLARAEARLDAYADAWLLRYEEACAVTSASTRDRRITCLHRARTQLEAVGFALAELDETTIANADAVLGSLRPLRACAQDGLPAPAREDSKAVDRARVLLATAVTERAMGKFEPAAANIAEARRRMEETTYLPLRAEVALAEATLTYGRGDAVGGVEALEEALRQAATAGHRDVIFEATLGLLLLLPELDRAEDALGYVDLAETTIDGDPLRRSQVQAHRAMIYEATGRWDEAEALLQEVLGYRLEAFGTEADEVARVHGGLGNLYTSAGRLRDAAREHGRAVEIGVAVYGEDHPQLGVGHNNLGNVLYELGEYELAEAHLRRARELWERSLGPMHPHVATALDNLGRTLTRLDRGDEAEPLHRRALRIRKEALPPEHPLLAATRSSLGEALRVQGRLEEAAAEFERAR